MSFLGNDPKRCTIEAFLGRIFTGIRRGGSMANFCGNCGATLSGVFCNKCGARAQEPAPAAQPPVEPAFQPVAIPQTPVAAQPAAAVAAKGSGLGKILLIVGGVLLLLFLIAVGSAIYGVYWVKHKVSTYTSAVTGGD